MLRLFFLLGVFTIFGSCNPDERGHLIRQYELVWETNLMDRYAQLEPLPAVIPSFRFVFINPDGSVYVLHSPADYSEATTVTLLNTEGEFVGDITLNGEYVFDIAENDAGFMQTLSRSGEVYLIKTWNENLGAIPTKVLPQPTYFHQLFIRKSAYYEIRFNAENSSYSLSRFSFSDVPEWTRLFSDYGITGYAAPIFFPESNDFILARNNASYDSLCVVKANGGTGAALWLKRFSLASLHATNQLPKVIPAADGHVLIFNNYRYWAIPPNGLTVYSGNIGNTQSIPESFVTHCIREDDGGYLLATTFAPEEGWDGFRLIKTDRGFNVGWTGNFHQSVTGYLSGVVRHGNLTVWLTSNGYLYALRPVF